MVFLYKDACNCMGKPSADLWMKKAFKPQRYVFTADLLCFHARWFLLCGNMKQFVAIKQLWLKKLLIFCSQILFEHSTTRYSKSSLKDMNEKLPKKTATKWLNAMILYMQCFYQSAPSVYIHQEGLSLSTNLIHLLKVETRALKTFLGQVQKLYHLWSHMNLTLDSSDKQIHVTCFSTNPFEMPTEQRKQCASLGQKKVAPGGKMMHPIAFSGPIRAWSTNWNLFSPTNGREISSSVYGQTRRTQL